MSHLASRRVVRTLSYTAAVLGTFLLSAVAQAGVSRVALQGGFAHGHFGSQLGGIAPYPVDNGAAGISVGFRAQPWLSVQSEAWWVRKGGKYEQGFSFTGSPENVTLQTSARYTLDYVELPVLARLEPGTTQFFHPHVILGAAPAFRVASDSDVRFQDVPYLPPSALRMAPIFEGVGVFPGPDHYQSFDLDLVAGVGLSFGRGPWAVELEGRYLHGLMDVMPSGSSFHGYNRTVLFTMGVRVH